MGTVKIRTPQNPNPSTNYDKTLQNWFPLWFERVTKIWYKSEVRQRLAKCVKYKAFSYFYFYSDFLMLYYILWNIRHCLFNFFPGLAYWIDPWADFDAQWLKTRVIAQGCAFLGPHDGRQHLMVQIPQKPSKLGMNMHCRSILAVLHTLYFTANYSFTPTNVHRSLQS